MSSATKSSAALYRQFGAMLLLSAWAGLVTGYVEGAGLLAFQNFGWMNWTMGLFPVGLPILWVSPAFDLILFLVVGVLLAVGGRLAPRFVSLRVAAFVFALLAFFDWLGWSGRIAHKGMLVLAAGLASVYFRWFRKNEEKALRIAQRSLLPLAAGVPLLWLGVNMQAQLAESRATANLAQSPPDSPNILVVIFDTTRADHLSVDGYPRATTPYLETFARQGVLFQNAFATSSWTLPSHASLLTGRWPHEHGAQDNFYRGGYPSIAEEMLRRGYRTGAFSANFYFFCRFRGLGAGFIHFDDIFATLTDSVMRAFYPRKIDKYILRKFVQDLPGRRRAAEINRSFLGWLDQQPQRPFFAVLNYLDSHDPYLPLPPYRTMFSKQAHPGGIVNERAGRLHPQMSPEQLQGEIDSYDGSVAYMDHCFGELMSELDRRGLKDMLVVLTADHGESLGDHGLFMHRNSLYLELIRVPLIIRWPGHVPAGLRFKRPVTNAALPATLLDLLGHGEQKIFPGPSLAALWSGASKDDDWPFPLSELAAVRESEWRVNPNYFGAMKAVVSPRWHLITHETQGVLLYDWVRDPAEADDLAKNAEGERVSDAFTRCMKQSINRLTEADCRTESPAPR
jgi:arylsulfatase A-like enzyme